ncbi:MAG: hypothetical protein ABSH53_06515 [Holophaga sp.]
MNISTNQEPPLEVWFLNGRQFGYIIHFPGKGYKFYFIEPGGQLRPAPSSGWNGNNGEDEYYLNQTETIPKLFWNIVSNVTPSDIPTEKLLRRVRFSYSGKLVAKIQF